MSASDSEWVTLLPSDIEYADAMGLERCRRGVNPKNMAPTRWEEALALDILGARCEVAGYMYYRPASYNQMRPKRPDFEGFIDVKGRGEEWNDLIIPENDLHYDWAYQLVFAHRHPQYEIAGWCWGHEIEHWRIEERKKDRPAMFVPRTDKVFKPARLLREELRRLQRFVYGLKEVTGPDSDPNVWIGVEDT